jgi:hypothetical protein
MQVVDIAFRLYKLTHDSSPDPLKMSTYEIANLLLKYGEIIIQYAEYSNQQLGNESAPFVTKENLKKIDSLFRELGNNFFPMAHTNVNLGKLRIVDGARCDQIRNLFDDFSNQILGLEREIPTAQLSEIRTRILQISEEFKDVINP